MSSVAPVPPPVPQTERRAGRSSRHGRRGFFHKLRRRKGFRRWVGTAVLWAATVAILLAILKQVIK